MVLETLSHSPRVFSLYNFMDMEEADQIIEDALGMTQEEYRLKVSVCVGPGCLVSKEGTRRTRTRYIRRAIPPPITIWDFQGRCIPGRYDLQQAHVARVEASPHT